MKKPFHLKATLAIVAFMGLLYACTNDGVTPADVTSIESAAAGSIDSTDTTGTVHDSLCHRGDSLGRHHGHFPFRGHPGDSIGHPPLDSLAGDSIHHQHHHHHPGPGVG